MKVIFTCGGTAGHINPAIALAGLITEKHPGSEILFVGAYTGLEKTLVPKAGYEFRAVHVSGFRRSLKQVRHNLKACYNVVRSAGEARRILKEFKPDLVVGTGGYASYPIVKAAAAQGIPTAVHESNMVPGLTTRQLESCVDCVMVGFAACREHYRNSEKVVVTGTPVRGDFFRYTKEEAREKLGLAEGKPLVVSFWGSLGASGMNEKMVEYIRLETEAGAPFHHIHAVGSAGYTAMLSDLKGQGVELEKYASVDVREYIYDMALVMRAADLVICRAGAATLSELTALGVPAIIVPSPYVTNNHQEKNARALEKTGAAELLLEKEADGRKMFDLTREILADRARWEKMHAASLEMGTLDASEKIYETVMSLCK
ncbi:MAG: undecaprenyldiphospho-muramoylpentapeptide beta-N-acetylglucosaminyltransferase [Oscillospiraceae bacterium]|nr:undecaprenyldiphospho-muramoylpentapeptide beta-N-acetylglucosaminyltransferase [Oscillospiraceae bacterium]